jgi:hypothetical protein
MLLQPSNKAVGIFVVEGKRAVDIFAGCCSCCLSSTPDKCTAAQAMSAVRVLQYVGQQVCWQLPPPGMVTVAVVVVAIIIRIFIRVNIVAAGVVELLCGVPLQVAQHPSHLALPLAATSVCDSHCRRGCCTNP